MKRLFLIVCLVLFWSSVAMAATAEVTLKWTPVVFPSGSDPAKSGVRVEKSLGHDTAKSIVGTTDVLTSTLVYAEEIDGEWCYYATAFNQTGDSPVSIPVCIFISSVPPPTPTGLDAISKILSDISATLKGMLTNMTGN